ncbi:MAG: DUF1573 domain-containing protein [Bacteroidales bacterium]
MKRICLFTLAMLMTGGLLLAQQKQAHLSFEKNIHDFGTIKEANGKVTYRFVFSNTGSTPLVLTEVRPTCGCTSPEWTKKPVMPGQEGYIDATFDPARRKGEFNKSIIVRSNGQPSTVVLRIKGNIIPRELTVEEKYPRAVGDFRMKSNHLAFVRVYSNQQKIDSIPVVNTGDQPLSITFRSVPSHIELKTVPETLKPGEKGIIWGRYDATQKNDWGFVIDRVHMYVNDEPSTRTNLTISAKVEEDFSHLSAEEKANAPHIKFEERTYNFGKAKQRTKVEHEYVFTNTGKKDLVIRKVRSTCGCTTTDPEKSVLAPGESSSLKAVFNTGAYKGFQRKSIYVITNDPTNANVRLTISGTVEPAK